MMLNPVAAHPAIERKSFTFPGKLAVPCLHDREASFHGPSETDQKTINLTNKAVRYLKTKAN